MKSDFLEFDTMMYYKQLLWSILKFFLMPLEFLEYEKLMLSKSRLKYPPIFIIGPPRSGTTLLYQLLVHHFHLAHFKNTTSPFFRVPVMTTKLILQFLKPGPYMSDFTSEYGVSHGWMAPGEAGEIWNRWYPTEDKEGYNYTPTGYLSDRNKHIIYETIALMEDIFQAPFINKNTKNSVRIQSLAEVFPDALFIQICRNPFDIANSILKARKERGKSVDDWWSAMPKEINQLKNKNYLEQICGQVFYIEKNIKEDIEKIGTEKLKIIDYETLCKHPQNQMDEIKAFLNTHGCSIQIKNEIPESFVRSEYKANALTKEQEIIKDLILCYYGKP